MRGYVSVSGRLVQYRRIGQGPPLVLLHGSPQSGAALQPLAAALAHRFTCYSLDTPGNGLSEPLALPAPSSADYAAALAQALDALGLGRILLYGFHTGAGTALEFLRRFPGRCAGLVCDGYAVWTEAERAEMLARYLPPLAPPSWDGSHLAFLWARIEEQRLFFPWYASDAAHRMSRDLPSVEALQADVLDLLRAGDAYRAPYAAAFQRRGETGFADVRDPVLILAQAQDPLAAHLARLPQELPAQVKLEPALSDRAAMLARAEAFLVECAPGLDLPATAVPDWATRSGLAYGFVTTEAGLLQAYVRRSGPGRPVLLLHDAGGSARLFAPTLAHLQGPAVALDFPGHGESDGETAPNIEALADAAAACLRELGLENPAAIGFHLGGQIALALRARGVAGKAALIGAPVFEPQEQAERLQRYAPSISPCWDGAHLLSAWRMLRRQALFHPWYDARAASAITAESQLAPDRLQRRFTDLMLAGENYRNAYQAQHEADTAALLGAAGGARLFLAPFDPLSAEPYAARALAHGEVQAQPIEADPARWAGPFGAFAG